MEVFGHPMEKMPVRHIKEPDLSGSFNIRELEPLLSDEDMVQELHRHSFFYVLVLKKGSGEHIIDFVPYPIGGQTVFFMRPGQAHRLVLKQGSTGFLMGFTHDFYAPAEKSAHQVLRKVSNKNFCTLDGARFKKIVSILSAVFREYTGRQERYHEVIRYMLQIFFVELLRQSRCGASSTDAGTEYMQERLEELQELIEQNLSAHKDVAFYAKEMHLSSYQLNAIAKATLGKTCSAVINDYIILEAKRYLLATTSQVNQIAAHLGYEDVSYFIRWFRKNTGVTPEVFRQNFA